MIDTFSGALMACHRKGNVGSSPRNINHTSMDYYREPNAVTNVYRPTHRTLSFKTGYCTPPAPTIQVRTNASFSHLDRS